MTANFAVAFGQHDAIATDAVDLADVLLVRSYDVHMFAHLAEHLALALTRVPPRRKVAVELRLILPAIIVIIAVEFVDLTTAPFAVVGIARRTGGRSHTGKAAGTVLAPIAA